METLFKLAVTGITICIIYWELQFVWTLWKSQIDSRATISHLVGKLKPKSELVVFRDDKKIYQGGVAVGDVVDEVLVDAADVTFKRLINTGRLVKDQTFEFRRMKLKIISIRQSVGMVNNMTDTGTMQEFDSISDVMCKRVAE